MKARCVKCGKLRAIAIAARGECWRCYKGMEPTLEGDPEKSLADVSDEELETVMSQQARTMHGYDGHAVYRRGVKLPAKAAKRLEKL